jgi:hypothetical protein
MIWDSNPWKHDLFKGAAFLDRLTVQQKPLTDRQRVSIERRLFLGFYAVRKLLEAHKLTDGCSNQEVSVKVYPPTGKAITHFNWHKSDEHFDFDSPASAAWPLVKLCHQFVHSYIFHVVEGETGGLTGFFIASDQQRSKGLIDIDVATVISVFRSVASDDITSLQWSRDLATGKESFIAS